MKYNTIFLLFIFILLSLTVNLSVASEENYHTLSEKTAIFIYQAFANDKRYNEKELLKYYFRLPFDELPADIAAAKSKNKNEQVKIFVNDLKVRNQILFIHRVPFPTYIDAKNAIEIELAPRSLSDFISEVPLAKYIYNDHLGDINISMKHHQNKILIPYTKKDYEQLSKSSHIYLKLFGKVIATNYDTSSYSETAEDLYGELSRPLRNIKIQVYQVKAFTQSGHMILTADL